jgi:hypothetical protein
VPRFDRVFRSAVPRRLPWRRLVVAVGIGAIVVGVSPASASAADGQAPTVTVTAPSAGANVAGTVSLGAGASDAVGVTQVKWYVDGAEVAWDGSAPWQQSWNSTQVADGPHRMFAKAADAAGNWGTSAAISITVSNQGGAPSGQPMPRGDLPGWKQIFADDFTTDVALGSFPGAVASSWSAYSDGSKDTSRNGTYFPSKVVSIRHGLMDLHLHTEGGIHMVAAPLPKLSATKPYGQLYGRHAVRFRADALHGYKTAWLLWPDSSRWPADGEIDFPEGDLDQGICAYMHHMGATSPSDQDWFCPRAAFTSWHTAVIEWTPTAVRFVLDGQLAGTSTSRIPSTPMHWVLQTETALSGGPPSAATDGHVQIDWVTAYRRG